MPPPWFGSYQSHQSPNQGDKVAHVSLLSQVGRAPGRLARVAGVTCRQAALQRGEGSATCGLSGSQECVPVPRHAVQGSMRIADCWAPAERTTTSRRERTVLCPRPRQDLHLFEAVTASTKHAPVNRRHPHRLSREAPRIQDSTHMHENNPCTHVYE
ncbi:hypothetical protein GCM10007079_51240 [Nocardiopsis terrae]|nr:hypothetical protein GCM10007079_51240 [Nocardiopsis terrae]